MRQSYRVAVARKFGPPEVIGIEEQAISVLPAGAVRVAVRAAGQNPVDARRRAGTFGGRPPLLFGTEFSGVVYESNDPLWNVGDEVIGWGSMGADADLVITDGSRLAKKHPDIDWLVAGGLSGAGQTALTVLNTLQLPEGSLLLVHGASGGVGTALVQLAVARGLEVIGVAGASNQEYLRSLGAAPVVYGPGLAQRVVEAAKGQPINASVDMAGTPEAGDVSVGVQQAGGQAVTIVPETASSHGLPLIRVQHSAAQFEELVQGYLAGRLKLEIDALAFTSVVEAHRRMDSKHSRGKLVLDFSDNPFLNTL